MKPFIEIRYNGAGFGTWTSMLSFLFGNHFLVKITTSPSQYQFVKDSLKIFGLQDRAEILLEENVENSLPMDDLIGTFSPKIKINYIKPFHQNLALMPCYPNSNKVFTNYLKAEKYVSVKCFTLDEYAGLFKHLKLLHFDIINLDSHTIPVIDRVKFLKKHCKFLIGYEGGMCHLAHILDIPCIILPWTRKRSTNEVDHWCHLIHLDKKTYFASLDEILSLNKEQFEELILKLTWGQGNNFFLQNESTIKFDGEDLIGTLNGSSFNISKCIDEISKSCNLGNFYDSIYWKVAQEMNFKYGLGGLKQIIL